MESIRGQVSDELLSLAQQALASDLKTFGENDPQVATYRNNLAEAWYALGDYKKASAYLKRVLRKC